LTFFPLYFAISTYTRTAHQRVLQQQAVELARLVAMALPSTPSDYVPDDRVRALLNERIAAVRLTGRTGVQFELARDPSLLRDAPALGTHAPSLSWRNDGVWVTRAQTDGHALSVFVGNPASAFAR